MNLRKRYDAATADLEAPFAIVDLDAFRANAADLVRRAAGKPIRVASKSVRCRALLQEVLRMDGFQGVMAFTLPEALWLAELRVSDDILVAYPTADLAAIAQLARDEHAAATITLMVDSTDHLELIHRAISEGSAAQSGRTAAVAARTASAAGSGTPDAGAARTAGAAGSGTAAAVATRTGGAGQPDAAGSAEGSPSGAGDGSGLAATGEVRTGGASPSDRAAEGAQTAAGGDPTAAEGFTARPAGAGAGRTAGGGGNGAVAGEFGGAGVQGAGPAATAGGGGGRVIRVCIDIDAAYRALGGRVRIGARRSPVHTPEQAAKLASAIMRDGSLRLVGLMAYESQIAGVGDAPPGKPGMGRVIRAMQARSRLELARRRAAIVRAVRRVCPGLEFVNGGGTGSVEGTAAERAITEVAAGSGLYQPHLFDYYTNFHGRPAALFALPVVRRPGPGVVTCLGGGYLASGPGDKIRLPQPYLPAGLSYDSNEGAGEVQTPLLGKAADLLVIGDRVWFRHTKAGELCERFAELHLIEGDRVVSTVPTYRGEGKTFL